ncbi:MAG: hypothetical protein JWM82_1604 [Myxococcales bacterium]|nr:hypothetical protein [Myxococcales bacterium]
MGRLPCWPALALLCGLLGVCGGACEGAPIVFVGSGTGTPRALPQTWQEHWFEHTQLLSLAHVDANVAVYLDADVDRAKVAPLYPFLSQMWAYTLATYGELGPGRLYVVLHQGRYAGCHRDNHFSAMHDNRDVMDCGFASYDDLGAPTFLVEHMAANIVETTSHDHDGSPAYPLWGDSKWAEFFQYDIDRALGRTDQADVEFAEWTSDTWVDAFPVAKCHWFRDWFHPIWRDDGGAAVMTRFFASLAASFPGDGRHYARDLNWGEFVHFMSGAAHRDLKPLATTAFGWPPAWDAQYARARLDFPQITY